MKPCIELALVTSTVCNLGCKTCPGGRKEKMVGSNMTPEMCNRILDKCCAESFVKVVRPYFYNEPLLLDTTPAIVQACIEHRIPTVLSTNLNKFDPIGPAVLKFPLETLIISVSGFTQSTYQRSHKGGDIEAVKVNMERVAVLRHPKTRIQVAWHRYAYNEHELPAMQHYAQSLGFNFVPFVTSLLPAERVMQVWSTGIDDPAAEDLLIPVKAAEHMCLARKHWDCNFHGLIGVDGDGSILNCCNKTSQANLRGSLFDTTIPAFLKARTHDYDCGICMAYGIHIYTMQAYTRSEWSPARLAGVAFRRLHLADFIEPWLRRFYGRNLLPKP